MGQAEACPRQAGRPVLLRGDLHYEVGDLFPLAHKELVRDSGGNVDTVLRMVVLVHLLKPLPHGRGSLGAARVSKRSGNT
jgi:hypothetical protein